MANQCKKGTDNYMNDDNPYGLPNATQTGRDIFACRVNGQNWIAKTDIYNLGAYVSIGNDTLSFGAGGGGIPFSRLSFFIRNPQQAITYRLNDLQTKYGWVFITPASNPCVGATYNSYSIDGSLTITKFEVATKIVSGTFNCIIPLPNNCDTLKITDGRFDIKYHN